MHEKLLIIFKNTYMVKDSCPKNTSVYIWNAVKTSGCIYVSWRQVSGVVCCV